MRQIESDDYLMIYSNCIITKGYNRSLIIDTQRGEFFIIPNTFFDILEEMKIKPLQSIISKYKSKDDLKTLMQYIKYLEKKELAFYTKTPNRFPDISLGYESSTIISNAIIEIKKSIPQNMLNRLQEIEELGCQALQIIMYENLSSEDIEVFLLMLKNISIRYIELLLNSDEFYTLNRIKALLKRNPDLNKIVIYGHNKEIQPVKLKYQTLEVRTVALHSSSQCGQMGPQYFNCSLNHIIDAKNHNSCLHGKITIDHLGNLRNCHHSKIFATNSNLLIKEYLNDKKNTFLMQIKKDEIEVCKDCEFRYICTDCRQIISIDDNVYSKPKNCKYDPYKNIWD